MAFISDSLWLFLIFFEKTRNIRVPLPILPLYDRFWGFYDGRTGPEGPARPRATQARAEQACSCTRSTARQEFPAPHASEAALWRLLYLASLNLTEALLAGLDLTQRGVKI